MYRISFYSFLVVMLVACATDTTNNTNEPNTAPDQLPTIEDPVIVTLDSIQAEGAQTPEIDSMATIREIDESGNFTKKSGAIDSANSPQGFSYTALAKKSFKCMGNEPYWNIEIKGDELMFHQMGYEKEVYPLNPTQTKSDRLIYEVKEKSGKNSIKIELVKTPCEDDMSGKPFAYAVVLHKNGKIFKGCAKEILE